MAEFKLEKFEEIYNGELKAFRASAEKDHEKRVELQEELGMSIKTKFKMPKADDIPRDKFKKTLKYYHSNVFKTVQGNYFLKGKDGKVIPMGSKTFADVYGQTIKEFNSQLLKKDTTRYEVDIYDEDFVLDTEGKRINLAVPANFKYDPEYDLDDLTAKAKKRMDYVLDEFVLKTICNSNEDVYEYLLDMLSCMMHKKQTNAILILVGEAGTGKSKFIEFLQALFGQSCKMMTDQVLSGQDMFNSSMIGVSVGYLEETNGKGESNYLDIQRTLKRLSTAKYISCRKMQTDAFDVLNTINFVVVTNHIKDIKHDRRNFTLEPSTKHINDKEFYAKISRMLNDETVMEAIYHKLYDRDHAVWSRAIPKTDLMKDQLEKSSLSLAHEFLIDRFVHCDGPERLSMDALFKQFNEYLSDRGKEKMKINETIFRHEIRQFLPKDSYHPKNVAHWTTTEDVIRKQLHARNVTDAMIDARKDCGVVFEAGNDPSEYEELKSENARLSAKVSEQEAIIADQKALIEKLLAKTSKAEESDEEEEESDAKEPHKDLKSAWEHARDRINSTNMTRI